MLYYLLLGTVLGLSAGISPGPLLALVITETLRHDMAAGIKVALAPVVTDLPIILVTVFLSAKFSANPIIFGLISFAGSGLLLYMGYESLRVKGAAVDPAAQKPQSLRRGILVNAFSPHPYLFWISVGAPAVINAANESTMAAICFIIGFYLLLVGAKIVLAVLVGKSRSFLSGRIYLVLMRGLGLVLWGFAVLLFRDGMRLTGML